MIATTRAALLRGTTTQDALGDDVDDNSTPLRLYTDWVETARNVYTNPSFEVDGGVPNDIRRNFLTNPSFETNTAGWIVRGAGVTIARTTAEFDTGVASLQVTTPGTGNDEGAQFSGIPGTGATGSPHVHGVRVKAPVGALLRVGGSNNVNSVVDTPFVGTGAWQTVYMTGLIGAGAAVTFYVRTMTNAQAVTFYVDSALCEITAYALPLFHGDTVYPDSDFTAAWTFAAHGSASVVRGVFATNTSSRGARSLQWAKSGARSLRVVASGGSSTDSFSAVGGDAGGMRLGMIAGETYTAIATIRLAAPTDVSLGVPANARRIVLFYNTGTGGYRTLLSPQAPNVAGEYEIRFPFTVPIGSLEAFVRLYNGSNGATVSDVWYDDFALVAGAYTGPAFNGSTNPLGDLERTRWAGATDASESILETRTLLADYSDFPVSIIETSRREYDEASNTWRSVRYYSGRVSSNVPAKAGDRIRDNRDGSIYTVEEVERVPRGLSGRASVTLTMRRTAP